MSTTKQEVARRQRCSTCDSPAPHLHPAVQFEGEVSVCANEFHQRVTPQNRPIEQGAVATEQGQRFTAGPWMVVKHPTKYADLFTYTIEQTYKHEGHEHRYGIGDDCPHNAKLMAASPTMLTALLAAELELRGVEAVAAVHQMVTRAIVAAGGTIAPIANYVDDGIDHADDCPRSNAYDCECGQPEIHECTCGLI